MSVTGPVPTPTLDAYPRITENPGFEPLVRRNVGIVFRWVGSRVSNSPEYMWRSEDASWRTVWDMKLCRRVHVMMGHGHLHIVYSQFEYFRIQVIHFCPTIK